MGKFPVTNAEYRQYLKESGAPVPGFIDKPGFNADNQPVVAVSWEDACAYGAWLTQQLAENYRLPTDAEWEYSARGGALPHQRFPLGDEITLNNAWFDGQSAPRSGGHFPPNGFGLYDMIGNVWEWCADLFEQVSEGLPAKNRPTNKPASFNRVLRGGSYLTKNPLNLWIAYRHEDPPDLRHECIGFRMVRDR